MFYEEETLGKVYDLRLVRRFLGYFAPYKRAIVFILISLGVGTATALTGPWLIKVAVDGPLTAATAAADKSPFLKQLAWLTGAYLLVLAAEFLASYSRIVLVRKTSLAAITTLRNRLYAHLLHLHIRFFDTNPVGRLVTRTTNDINALQELFGAGFVMLVRDVAVLIGVVVMMFIASWEMTLIAFCVMPPLVAVALFFGRRARLAFRQVRKHLASVNAYINESVQGARVVSSFGTKQIHCAKLADMNQQLYEKQREGIFYFALFYPSVEMLMALATAGIVVYAAHAVLGAAITLGQFFLFWRLLNRFFRPILGLADRYTILQRAMASAERIFNLLDTQNPLTLPSDGFRPQKVEGRLALRSVRFSYDGKVDVLHSVSLDVRPSEHIAIVGPTGAGKTSIINLICHFYEPQEGEVLVEDVDVRRWNQALLRRHIALVPQDFFVFADTLFENIRLWDDGIGRDDVETALKEVGLSGLLSRVGGLDMELAERGADISVGERQLLSFARALVRKPAVIILDEATSSVDSQTERLVQDAMGRVLAGRTAVIIAHRLATIRNADRILVMNAGRVAEEGDHKELLRKGGLYAELYALQFRWQEAFS